MNKILNIFFISVIGVILLIILLHSDFQGGNKSVGENRYLAKMPSIKELSTNSFEKWINDNIGYRSSMMRLRAIIELKLFNKSSSTNVVIGKDGFLFFTGNENIEIALNKYPYTNDEYKYISKNLETLNNILEKQNIKFIYFMPPSKASIYPEKIRGYNLDITETPVDILAKYLPKNVKYINVKKYLLDNKNKQSIDNLYWKTDTHWTYYGAYLGYLAIIEQMNEWNLYKDSIIPVNVKYEDDYKLGDLASMMGGEGIIAKEAFKRTVIENPTFIKNELSDVLLKLQSEAKGSSIYSYSNPSCKNGLNVLAIGDSMFGSWNISELFSQTFCKYTFVWNINFSQELIDEVKPDIIIFEAGERTLKYSVFNKIKDYLGVDNIQKASLIQIDNVIHNNNLIFHIDKQEYKNNILTLQGWIYDKSDSTTGNVFIRIKDGNNNIKIYTTQKHKRPDVGKFYGNDRIDDCGFSTDISVDDKYEILDIILEKKGVYYSISAADNYKKKNVSKTFEIQKTITSNSIDFGIDKTEYKDNILILQGWIYDKSDNATGNVFIRIKDGDNKIKVYSTQIQQRPDVVNFFNNKKLINSGFIAYIPVDNNYEILDLILEKKGVYYSISAAKNNDNKNASKDIKIKETMVGDNIIFGIDKNEYKNNILTIQGWIYDKSDNATGNVLIRIKDGSNNIKAYAAQIQQRQDVAKYFNNDKLINSGFISSIQVDSRYTILDLILEKNGVYYSVSAVKNDDHKNVSKDIKIKETIVGDNIIFGIDKKEYNNNILTLNGWLYDKNDSATGNVFIRIKDGSNNIKVYAAQIQQRPDVVKYFNNNKLINSGFKADIKIDSNYKILDIILEKDGKYFSKPMDIK